MNNSSSSNKMKRPTKLVHYDTLMSKLPKDTVTRMGMEIASIETTQAPVQKQAGKSRQHQVRTYTVYVLFFLILK